MEETPKPLSDVVRTMHAFRFEAGAPGPARDAQCNAPPGVAGPATAAAAYAAALCEAVRVAERAVMYALGFELSVTHPFEAMAATVRGLELEHGGNGNGGGNGGGPGTTPASAPGTPATAASVAADAAGAPLPLPPRQAVLQQGINLIFDSAHTPLSLAHGPAAVAGGVVMAVLTLLGMPRLKWRPPGGAQGATPASQAPGGGGGGGGTTPASQGPPPPPVADGPVPWWDAPPLAGVEVDEMAAVCRVLLERYAGGRTGKEAGGG